MKAVAAVIFMFALVVLAIRFAPPPKGGSNFSQYPGFAEYFKANPPGYALPSPDDSELLERHKPRFFAGPDAEGPINFYRDYVACGRLTAVTMAEAINGVTRDQLNANKDDESAVFTHRNCRTADPVIYARINRLTAADAPIHRNLTLLTYHAVFRRSGLPAGMAWWQKYTAMAVGDIDDWHQLDHFTAVTIVLNEAQRPVAVMMQQHNYQRTYIQENPGRVEIDIALASNELYPHIPGRVPRRAVSHLTLDALRYLIGVDGPPLTAAEDITEGEKEIDYRLEYLPPNDAFYTFKGFLGERRRLPGRDGPPGAQYNTLPAYKPLGIQLAMSFWREGNAGDISRLPKDDSTAAFLAFAAAQADVLKAALRAD